MTTFISIIITIVTFGILIMIHELGHFLVAKKCGVKINEFSIGMGPAIYKKQGRETLFSIRVLPIGGYVKLEGEDEESDPDNDRAFGNKTKLQKVAILIAGAVMNIIFGVLVMFVINCSVNGFVTNRVDTVQLAEQNVLQSGDEIVNVDGFTVLNSTDLNFAVSNVETKEFSATIIRNGERLKVTVPFIETENGYKVGITLQSEKNSIGSVIKYTFTESLSIIRLVWKSLVYLVTGRVGIGELSGPVGIATLVKQTVEIGWRNVLYLVSLIALNLGVMNLLPIPALDGGRIFMIVVEAIIRRPIPEKFEGLVHAIGFVLLMGLTCFVFINDIIKVIKK